MLLDCSVVRRLLSAVSIRCCPPDCRNCLAGTCRGPLLLLPHVKVLLRCLLLDQSIRCCMLVSGVFSTQKMCVDAQMSSKSVTVSVNPFASILARTLLPLSRRTERDWMMFLLCSGVRVLMSTSM